MDIPIPFVLHLTKNKRTRYSMSENSKRLVRWCMFVDWVRFTSILSAICFFILSTMKECQDYRCMEDRALRLLFVYTAIALIIVASCGFIWWLYTVDTKDWAWSYLEFDSESDKNIPPSDMLWTLSFDINSIKALRWLGEDRELEAYYIRIPVRFLSTLVVFHIALFFGYLLFGYWLGGVLALTVSYFLTPEVVGIYYRPKDDKETNKE